MRAATRTTSGGGRCSTVRWAREKAVVIPGPPWMAGHVAEGRRGAKADPAGRCRACGTTPVGHGDPKHPPRTLREHPEVTVHAGVRVGTCLLGRQHSADSLA